MQNPMSHQQIQKELFIDGAKIILNFPETEETKRLEQAKELLIHSISAMEKVK